MFDRLSDEADRIDVLDLAARAEILADTAHGHIDVGAHGAFVHIAVAGAEIAQDRTQLGQIGLGLVGGAQVRLGDDFHQRDAGAVEIDIAHRRMLVVHRFAGILFQMQPLDADLDILEIALLVRTDRHDDRPLADDRILVLRYLVALRQIGIEVVLAIENRAVIDPAAFSPRPVRTGPVARTPRLMTGNIPGIAASTSETLSFGALAEFRGCAGKQFRIGQHLRMDFHADNDLPVTGGTRDLVVSDLACVCRQSSFRSFLLLEFSRGSIGFFRPRYRLNQCTEPVQAFQFSSHPAFQFFATWFGFAEID